MIGSHLAVAAGWTEVMSRLALCLSVIAALWSASVLSLSGGSVFAPGKSQ